MILEFSGWPDLTTWQPTCYYLLQSEVCDEMVISDIVEIFGLYFKTLINQISIQNNSIDSVHY